MKKLKTTVFCVAIVLVALFLCSAGSENVAGGGSSSGGGQEGGGVTGGGQTGDSMTEAQAITAIKQLTADSPMLTVKLTGVTTISGSLKNAIKSAPDGKINLDLSQTQITEIAESAFAQCDSLASVIIGSGVTSIGQLAFSSCDSLTSVTIPDGVEKIERLAFYGCMSLANVTIPSTVTSIGKNAFQLCNSLKSVIIKAPSLLSVTAFPDIRDTTKIFVPADKIDFYKRFWEEYADKIFPISES